MTPTKTEYEKSLELALKYLTYRPRSRAEIQAYLIQKGIDAQAVSKTLQELETNGWINDPEFARLWVENRGRLKPKGRYALKIELQQKGIEPPVIDRALADYDEAAYAAAALKSKIHQWRHLDKEDRQKKIFGFLRRRGFGVQTCMQFSRHPLPEPPAD